MSGSCRVLLCLRVFVITLLALLFQGSSKAHAQYKALVCRGGFEGLAVFADGSLLPVKAHLDLLDVRTRRIVGELQIGESVVRQLGGTFSASGQCTLQGETGEVSVVLKLQWHPAEGGASAFTGSVVGKSKDSSLEGSIVLFRWFPQDGRVIPDIVGTYEGVFVGRSNEGSLTLIVDNSTDKAFMSTMTFTVGGATTTFVAWCDINPDGVFFASGVSEDGIIILLEGEISEASVLVANYLIETVKGKPLDAGSILTGQIN